jgi:hypothetical protein
MRTVVRESETLLQAMHVEHGSLMQFVHTVTKTDISQ